MESGNRRYAGHLDLSYNSRMCDFIASFQRCHHDLHDAVERYDARPVDKTYRNALLAIQDTLLHACPACQGEIVALVATSMDWPRHRGIQLVLLEVLLHPELIAERTPVEIH